MKIKIIEAGTGVELSEMNFSDIESRSDGFGSSTTEPVAKLIAQWSSDKPIDAAISTSPILTINDEKYYVQEKTYFFKERTFYVTVSKATPEQLASPHLFQMVESEDMLEALEGMAIKDIQAVWESEKRHEKLVSS